MLLDKKKHFFIPLILNAEHFTFMSNISVLMHRLLVTGTMNSYS